MTDAIALHVAAIEEPITTCAFFAIKPLMSWTATAGVDWSSRILNFTGRPRMPPSLLMYCSITPSDAPSFLPKNAPGPVTERMALISYGAGWASARLPSASDAPIA
jgi:hypothetical protein